jgi:filamentous hemagglutinin family protein
MIAQNNQQLIQQTLPKFANIPQKLDKIFSNYQIRERFFLNTQPRISHSLIFGSVFSLSLLSSIFQPVKAQITADDSVDTQVKNSGGVSEITDGTTRGSNLFHSFQNFSIASGNTALFNNASNIENIISRVTGSSISNIDGLIQANGNANLILINPNGINFGANAQLAIGGSFLASSADSIVFDDGTLYSATNTDTTPLLTVSVPVGLQLGQNSGAINVEGTGHNLSLAVPIFSPFTNGEVSGLKVQPGQTLGLVGGNISLTGGVLAAEAGNIELGSVAAGIVNLNLEQQGFSLSYEDVSAFKNINLEQRAFIDASGFNGGSVQIQANEVKLTDGSAVLIQNLGEESSGNLKVNTANSLSVNGATADGIIASGLYTEALAGGKGGNIEIDSSQLEVVDGGAILTDTFSTAASGNLELNVSDVVEIVGFAAINPNKFSVISAQTFGAGDAGTINITTKNLTALDGGNVASLTGGLTGTGSGGNVNINAQESINLTGINPIAFAPSQITAGSGGAGNAGNVNLATKNIVIKDGGRIDASATASGNAGNVGINASESITVAGTVPDSLNPSLIIASANILDPELRELLRLPSIPSGDSGSVTIATPQLRIMDGGVVTVRNDGTGDAGNLQIKANLLELANNGGITGVVQEGSGGTIELEIADSVNLTGGSQIASDNLGGKDGGEITITANELKISDRSFITTTSFSSGKGGDITLDITDSINIQGIGFKQFQQTFQANAINGSLEAGTRGTGIFIGTAADGTGGNLKIATNSLSLREGGIIFSPIFTGGTGGNIEIDASDIDISGSALQISSGIESNNSAAAGNILIDTQRLKLQDGGTIVNANFGDATGGNIDINAAEFVNVQNTPVGSLLFTGIYSNTSIGTGNGGNINLKTANLSIDQGLLTSNTGAFIDEGLNFDGGGDGGNINVDVEDTIEITGITTSPRFVSGISSSSFTDGAAGDIKISTSKLLIRDGSEIAAAAIASGSGGDLIINASDSIELIGRTTADNLQLGGLVAASGREAFTGQVASGVSGDIQITTNNLTIANGASIDVQSLGTGKAGNLNINVQDSILLDNQGTISAATNFNTGGNIEIIADTIFWRGQSTTTATANNNANGGNIDLEANNLFVLEASQLTADADIGRGGNINVNTEGLLICEECRISASSELGVDGEVNIDTLDPNPNVEIVDMPIQLTEPEEVVALACATNQQPNTSQLTISGRGGLPPRPNEPLTSKSVIGFNKSDNQAQLSRTKRNSKLPAPARNWYVNSQGEVILTAQTAAAPTQFNSPDCHVR